MDNGKTLDFRGDENVKYADVASGGVGMTMVVRIRGGKFERLEPAFMIFQTNLKIIRVVAYQMISQAWPIGPDPKDGWTSKLCTIISKSVR